jgi:hypothetical protein
LGENPRYLINPKVSRFALWVFQVTFCARFFDAKFVQFNFPCIGPIDYRFNKGYTFHGDRTHILRRSTYIALLIVSRNTTIPNIVLVNPYSKYTCFPLNVRISLLDSFLPNYGRKKVAFLRWFSDYLCVPMQYYMRPLFSINSATADE